MKNETCADPAQDIQLTQTDFFISSEFIERPGYVNLSIQADYGMNLKSIDNRIIPWREEFDGDQIRHQDFNPMGEYFFAYAPMDCADEIIGTLKNHPEIMEVNNELTTRGVELNNKVQNEILIMQQLNNKRIENPGKQLLPTLNSYIANELNPLSGRNIVAALKVFIESQDGIDSLYDRLRAWQNVRQAEKENAAYDDNKAFLSVLNKGIETNVDQQTKFQIWAQNKVNFTSVPRLVFTVIGLYFEEGQDLSDPDDCGFSCELPGLGNSSTDLTDVGFSAEQKDTSKTGYSSFNLFSTTHKSPPSPDISDDLRLDAVCMLANKRVLLKNSINPLDCEKEKPLQNEIRQRDPYLLEDEDAKNSSSWGNCTIM